MCYIHLQIHSGQEPKPVGSTAEQVSHTVCMCEYIRREGERVREGRSAPLYSSIVHLTLPYQLLY